MRRALFFLILLFFAVPALAYVLPPSFVLRQWSEKLESAKNIRIRQQTTFFDGKGPQGFTVVSEEIWMKRTGQFRKTASTSVGKADYLFTKDRAGRVTAGKFEPQPLFDVLGPAGILYLFSDRQRLLSALRQAGVDVDQSKLALSGRQVQIEIGDPSGSKVWFIKDENIPVAAEIGGKSYKFEYHPTSKFAIKYPNVIEMSVGGKVLEKTEVTRVDMNVQMPDSQFDVPLLRSGSDKK